MLLPAYHAYVRERQRSKNNKNKNKVVIRAARAIRTLIAAKNIVFQGVFSIFFDYFLNNSIT
jgi:hypothetical protein